MTNSYSYNATGSVQNFTVKQSGIYDIVAYGAQGGGGLFESAIGGKGAETGGYVKLVAGERIKVVVGSAGGKGNVWGGGGGGSFVLGSTDNGASYTVLIASGGGGGVSNPNQNGGGGYSAASGSGSGYGGSGPGYSGGNGAGFRGGGQNRGQPGSGYPAASYTSSGQGGFFGADGGFGGGGGGGSGGGGGGGGYSGGNGGYSGTGGAGTGGTSIDKGIPIAAQTLAAVRQGNGLVILTLVDSGPTVSVAGSIGALEKGQSEQIGSVMAGAAGQTVVLTQTGGSGTVSLGALQSDGSYQVFYTAPGTVATSGNDAVSFTATDAQSGATTPSATSIAVPLDAGPTLVQQAPKIVEAGQTTVIGTVTPGLAGDTETLTQTAGSPGTLSLVSKNDGSGALQVVYTASKSVPSSSMDKVAYTITDQHMDTSASGSASVQLDSGPTSGAVSASVKLGATVDLTAAVQNAVAKGLAGDTVTITGDNTTGTAGQVSLVGGDLKYTASGAGLSHIAANGSQTDSFTYTVTDENGGMSTGAVKLTVSNPATVINGSASGFATIQGTSGTDIINAFGLFNTIYSNGGNDVVNAGLGNATVYAGPGDVVTNLNGVGNGVTGGDGNETVSGSVGATFVALGNGNDTVMVGGLANRVTLGNGNDAVTATGGVGAITLGSGTDTVKLGGLGDAVTLNGSTATMSGGQGADIVTVNGGIDTLTFSGLGDVANLNGTAAVSITDLANALRVNVGSSTQTDTISGFFSKDSLGLVDLLNGAGGYKSAGDVLSHLVSDGHGGTMLALGTTGSIDFAGTGKSQFSAANFRVG